MKILLINYEYPPIGGGAGNATHFMGQSLSKIGHDVSILTTAWDEEQGTLNKNGVTIYRVKAKRSDPSSASTLEKLHFIWVARKFLKKLLHTYKFDASIIYFTIPCGPLGLTLKAHNIPYVISLRGGDVPGLVPEINFIHWLITPLRRKVLNKAIATVANAKGLADLSEKADPTPVMVIPNGVDTTFFTENKKKISPSHTQFLFVGRFHPQKNLKCLLEQFKKLKYKSKKKFTLHLVGNGPLEQDLKKLAKNLDIENELVWHGWMNKTELKELHQTSDIFINPSHYEGLPNAVLEAMASGLTIIVSDVPGNNDLIVKDCGYTYPIDSPSELYLKLEQAHEAPNPTYGKNARERAVETYSWDHVAKSYADLLNA